MALTACGGSAAKPAPTPTPRPVALVKPQPKVNPSFEGIAAALLGASSTLHRSSSELQDASDALTQTLTDSAAINAGLALGNVTRTRAYMARLPVPSAYAKAYRLLGQAAAYFAASANEYVRSAKGDGSAQQRADNDAASASWYLQRADAVLAARPETRLQSVRDQARLIAARLQTAPTPPRKKVVWRPATKIVHRAVATPRPAPTRQVFFVVRTSTPVPPTPTPVRPTATPTAAPSATPKPKPQPAVAQAKPTPTPDTHAAATATAVARGLAAATERAHEQSLAQRATLLAFINKVKAASARVKKARSRIEKSAAQADFDPVLFAKATKDMHTATAHLKRISRQLHHTRFSSTAYLQLQQVVDSAIVSYRTATVQLGLVIRDVQSGDRPAASSDLTGANDDLSRADAAVKGAEEILKQTS